MKAIINVRENGMDIPPDSEWLFDGPFRGPYLDRYYTEAMAQNINDCRRRDILAGTYEFLPRKCKVVQRTVIYGDWEDVQD